jgi:hypothetical protein
VSAILPVLGEAIPRFLGKRGERDEFDGASVCDVKCRARTETAIVVVDETGQ